MTLSMSVFTQLTRLQFNPATASVHSGAVLQVELTLRCLMPASVRIQQLAASMHFDLERGGTNGRSKAGQRQTNPGAVEFQQANSMAAPHLSSAGPSLELDEIQDRSPSDNSLISAGVVCKNTHLVMRRHDSNSPPDSPNNTSPPAVAMMEGALMLKVQDVTLEPGNNSIVFTAPVRAPSLWFSLKQQKYHMTFRKTWESRLSLSQSFLFSYPFPLVFSLCLCRVGNQALIHCASYTPQWVRCSLCCLTSTHQSSTKSILRSPNSLWSRYQVWYWQEYEVF